MADTTHKPGCRQRIDVCSGRDVLDVLNLMFRCLDVLNLRSGFRRIETAWSS